jgi:hypothetical protein
MNYYVKELPDNTLTLMTDSGYIIGKFDAIDELENICFDGEPTDWSQTMVSERAKLPTTA